MTTNDMLSFLKVDLGISTTAYDERLTQYLETAQSEIIREGATLDVGDINDCNLIIQYASWMWRKRDSGDGMPRMVRYALNNRIFSEKMKEDG